MKLVMTLLVRDEEDIVRENLDFHLAQGVDQVIEVHRVRRRKPRALFALDDPLLDDPTRVNEALEGFGED